MLRLRPYRKSDAGVIVSWINNERIFRYWCADRFDKFPITADDLNDQYDHSPGANDVFHFTAYDGKEIAGHINIRFPEPGNIDTVRFGYVIISPERRSCGLGKEMIALTLQYAFDIMKAKKVTIGVFEENEPALRCYLSSGFKDTGKVSDFCYYDEKWKCRELEIVKGEE